jgi:hypothetical protein
LGAAVNTAVCPRCERERDRREGPYFVCVDCRWRWTVSVTGKVYVQSAWRQSALPERSEHLARRLLWSVEGLTDKLAAPWPAAGAADESPSVSHNDFSPRDIARLRRARDATSAGYYHEGLPLSKLRAEGIELPPAPADDGD